MTALTTLAGTLGYLAARAGGRLFALAFGLLAAAGLLVVACP